MAAISLNFANASEAEIKAAKRDHEIRKREKEFEQRRAEEEEKKKADLEDARRLEKEQQRLEQERTMKFLADRAKRKADKKRQQEKKDALRDENIVKREAAWRAKADAAIEALKDAHDEHLEYVESNRKIARDKKQAKRDAERQKMLCAKGKREDADAQREENEGEHATRRLVKELSRVDAIKADAEDELRSFLNNPAPVPLKQVLAGRLRPVPTVTELLAAHRDQAEDLKELEDSDIPMRALLCKQTLFEYIRDIQAKAEANRIKPPEPVVGDMGRGVRSKSPKRAGSPKSTTGSFRKGSPSKMGSTMRSNMNSTMRSTM
jgi:hypothetical protein